jgi:hypothetical protein
MPRLDRRAVYTLGAPTRAGAYDLFGRGAGLDRPNALATSWRVAIAVDDWDVEIRRVLGCVGVDVAE